MKYIKTFEKYIDVELDENDQVYLMTEYIREYAVSKNDEYKKSLYDKMKNLFENGLDPNSTYPNSSVPFIYIFERENVYNLDIMKLFVKHGLSGKIAKTIIDSDISYSFGSRKLPKIMTLLDTDVNLLDKIKSGSNTFDKLNFFEAMDKLKERDDMKDSVEKLLKEVKLKKPEQYKKYLINKEAEKYNL